MSELPDRFIVIETELNRTWLIERYGTASWVQKIWGRDGWHYHDDIGEPSARMMYQSECVFVEASE